MPVLINKETGLAENLPDASPLKAGTHEIPMYDPQGNFGSVPFDAAADLLKEGYTQPNSEQLQHIHDQGKYGTGTEQIKAALEGAASAATFGLSTAAESALLGNQKEQQKRAEVNPGVRAIGEGVGLLGSMLTGVGEGALLGKLGAAVIPEAATAIGRVGSMAARGAIENMAFQAGHEADKLFMGRDPHAIAETAIADIGLAALIGGATGGAFGAGSELWKAGPGKKLGELLSSITKRSEGLPVELREASGIHIPPELSAALSGAPEGERLLQVLNESNSKSGLKLQEALKDFHGNIKNAAVESLGKSVDDIDGILNASDYDAGKVLKDGLTKRMSEIVEPISKKYDEFAEKFKAAPISEQIKSDIANKVAASISELGLEKASSDVQLKAMNKFLEALPKQTNAHDLKLLATNLTEAHPFGSDTYRVGKILKGIVNDAREGVITENLGAKAPELLSEYQATQGAYKDVKGLIDDLNDRLHVGKSYGPESFIKNIKEAAPEDILRRLSPKGDVDLQSMLQKSFPEVADAVKASEINKLIKSSLTNGELNPKKLFNNIQKLSPEHKNFMMAPEQLKRIDALQELQNRIPTKMNPSGTAKTLDKLWSQVPGSASALGAMLFGHNPVAGYILGSITQHLSREVPDAARLAMLKFLGSSSEISAEGFHAASQLAAAVSKGEKAVSNSVKYVFDSGGKVIPFPSPASIKALEAQVKLVADQDPKGQQDMMSIGGKAAHYMPEATSALAMAGARNLQYLASLRPVDKAISPLDPDPVPNSEQLAKYQQALAIAQQPLIITKSIKNGSVTAEEIEHVKYMYPALYQRMNAKFVEELTKKPKGLSYATKIGISSFVGQPLDSTLLPNSIMSIQQSILPPNAQQMNIPIQPSATSMKGLQKLPGLNMTPGQNRESHRGGRH